MYPHSSLWNLYLHLVCVFCIPAVRLERTTQQPNMVMLNPCEYYNSKYAYAIIDCIWRDLPPNMSSRYSPRFKQLVQLDDDGVFKLLCQSIDQRGDMLLEAFANEYSKEDEKRLFLDVVLACHKDTLEAINQLKSDEALSTRSTSKVTSHMSSPMAMKATFRQSGGTDER